MGVKGFWKQSLGKFRDQEVMKLAALPHKCVVIDTSAWMHTQDGIWEVCYARTSNPIYSHPAIITTFSARVRALKAIGIHPIFVFDGKPPTVKKRTNIERQVKSSAAAEKYTTMVQQIKDDEIDITDDVRKEAHKLRREKSRPVLEDYATLCHWFVDNDIEFVQAPFEADAQIKQIINEGRATAAITEDGDLVVFEVPYIMSQAKITTLDPKESTCQYFQVSELKGGVYDSAIALGCRSQYLAEISCLSGNDYIANIPDVGPAKIFGSHKGRKNQSSALIDSFIDNTVRNGTQTEEEWLVDFKNKFSKTTHENVTNNPLDNWTPELFIKVRNLIKYYPVFHKDSSSGVVTLVPLNPLPANISIDQWGSYIGFDKHPSEYFDCGYGEYYAMELIASQNVPRSNLLGTRYTEEDNPNVIPGRIQPVFSRLDFNQDPIDLQPPCVLRSYLLARGVTVPQDTSLSRIRDMARIAHNPAAKRYVLDPALIPKAAKWVGFEPLDEAEFGDEFDDWNSHFKIKMLEIRKIDDDFINEHFGTERAQYQRVTAMELLQGGNIGLSTLSVRNVSSKLRPNTKLIAIKFKCLSEGRNIMHSVYMVFENDRHKNNFVPSPASYCTCENGAFFCSHMLCFFYVVSGVQSRWNDLSEPDIKQLMPESRLIIQSIPCLIENILASNHIKRQRSQTKRQSKRGKSNCSNT